MSDTRNARRFGIAALALAIAACLLFLTQDPPHGDSAPAKRVDVAGAPAQPVPPATLEEPATEGAARDEVAHEFVSAPTTASSDVAEEQVVHGLVTLQDGAPLWGVELVALAYDEFELAKQSVDSRAIDKLKGFARCSSDANGKFILRVNAAHSDVESFVLRQEQHENLGQNWAIYTFQSSEPLRHSLPGSAIPVRVIAEDGSPASEVRVDVYVQPGSDPNTEYLEHMEMTNQAGQATLYFNTTSQVTLVSNSRDSRATAEARDVPVRLDGLANEVVLRLSSLEHTGTLKVQVVSEHGLLIDDFAVRIEPSSPHLQSRYVRSETLGPERIIDCLPPELVHVTLAPRYSGSPSLYSADEAPSRIITLDGKTTQSITFEVPVLARFAFKLQRTGEDSSSLKVRYRDTNSDPGLGWTALRDLWQYRDDGATCGTRMEQNTTYYSGPQPSALLEVEVVEHNSDKVRWSGQVQLTQGRVTLIELQLDR